MLPMPAVECACGYARKLKKVNVSPSRNGLPRSRRRTRSPRQPRSLSPRRSRRNPIHRRPMAWQRKISWQRCLTLSSFQASECHKSATFRHAFSILNTRLRPRFEYSGPKCARRKAAEEAWQKSSERKRVLADMPVSEQKKRKFI